MIQILGLREFTVKETGEVKLYDSHFANGWRANTVQELFNNIEHHISQIPADHRWNMFYTVSSCEEKKGRKFIEQTILPIDIDGIVPDTEAQVVDVTLKELGLLRKDVGIVHSGNGVHILIGLATPITDVNFFKTNRVYYRALCGRINQALYTAGVAGNADPSVFSGARLLRLPFTKNKKQGKPDRDCLLVNRTINFLDVDLISLSQLPELHEGDHIHPRAFTRFPDPDTKAVQEGCSFLQYCYNKQEEVNEPQWYAMLSIIGRLEDGAKLVHSYSENYSNYNADATDFKLEHSLEASGPRTCENIGNMYEGCKECPHYRKITSPIQIIGEDYIKTKDTGFYDIVIKNGMPVRGKPNYDDLLKHFQKGNDFFTLEDSEITYVYNGTHWVEISKLALHNFAEQSFEPSPTRSMCQEFEAKVKRTNIKPTSFTNTMGKLNFKNGVLDLEEMTLSPHSIDYGFTYCIPYDYEEEQPCPTFDKFMQDITLNNKELSNLLLEYMGYCISGTDPILVQQCAVLYGSGGNGKSVLLDLLRQILGPDNCSSVSMKNISKDTGRYAMMNKTVNITDETPTNVFLESSDFKAIVSGDTLEVRRLYSNSASWKCNTKLIFACNDLPYTSDFSDGLYRRLIIVPFRASFTHEKGNRDNLILDKLLAERSGILHTILKAYKNFKDRKYKFESVRVVEEQKEQYIEAGDTVLQFVTEMCNEELDKQVDIRTAYRCYVAWCEDTRTKYSSYNAFSRRFGKHLTKQFPTIEPKRINYNSGKITVYEKLAISASAPQL